MKAKAFIFYGAALLLLGALFAWVVLNTRRGPEPGEDLVPSLVVARVDGVGILAEEVNRLVNLSDQGTAADKDERRRDALDWLIERQLVYNEGERRGIEVTPEELEEHLQQYYEAKGGEEYVREQLSAGNQTIADLRKEIEFDILVEKIQSAVEGELRQEISVSEEEIKQFYEDNKESRFTRMEIEYLFIEKLERDAEIESKAVDLANQILEEIEEGKTFEELAREDTGIEGIRVSTGRFQQTDRVAEVLWKAAAGLQVGEYTKEPIDFINSGYQILKCLSKRVIPLDDVRDSIRQHLSAVKLNEGISDYFKGLRGKAQIELFLK